jgi:ABC-type oligopeptide transport system ATPase subunit
MGASKTVAVDDVDFAIRQGSICGLAGASGSGKSTLARCLAGLEAPTRGHVLFRGAGISDLSRADRLQFHHRVQLVLQDASNALNPRFTAARAIAEPLAVAGMGTAASRRSQALYWIETLGLEDAAADRPVLEFSGGQRQRLTIARALIGNPEFVIFDESFSALDMPLRAQILDLLSALRAKQDCGYLVISHDLSLLARTCDEIAVMHRGRIVEIARPAELLSNPVHEYSRKLVQAIPGLPPEACA